MNNSAKDSHLWDFGYNVLFFSWNLCLAVKFLGFIHVGLLEKVPRLEGYCSFTSPQPSLRASSWVDLHSFGCFLSSYRRSVVNWRLPSDRPVLGLVDHSLISLLFVWSVAIIFHSPGEFAEVQKNYFNGSAWQYRIVWALNAINPELC